MLMSQVMANLRFNASRPFTFVRRLILPWHSVPRWLLNGLIVMILTANVAPGPLFGTQGGSAAGKAWVRASGLVILYPVPLIFAGANVTSRLSSRFCGYIQINCTFAGLPDYTVTPPKIQKKTPAVKPAPKHS